MDLSKSEELVNSSDELEQLIAPQQKLLKEKKRKESVKDVEIGRIEKQCNEIAAQFQHLRHLIAIKDQEELDVGATDDKDDALISMDKDISESMDKDMAEAGEPREESTEELLEKIMFLHQEFEKEGIIKEDGMKSKLSRMWREVKEMQDQNKIKELEQIKAELVSKRMAASS